MFRSQQTKDRLAELALLRTKLRVRALELEIGVIRREFVRTQRIKWGTYQKRLEQRRQQELDRQRGR